MHCDHYTIEDCAVRITRSLAPALAAACRLHQARRLCWRHVIARSQRGQAPQAVPRAETASVLPVHAISDRGGRAFAGRRVLLGHRRQSGRRCSAMLLLRRRSLGLDGARSLTRSSSTPVACPNGRRLLARKHGRGVTQRGRSPLSCAYGGVARSRRSRIVSMLTVKLSAVLSVHDSCSRLFFAIALLLRSIRFVAPRIKLLHASRVS